MMNKRSKQVQSIGTWWIATRILIVLEHLRHFLLLFGRHLSEVDDESCQFFSVRAVLQQLNDYAQLLLAEASAK